MTRQDTYGTTREYCRFLNTLLLISSSFTPKVCEVFEVDVHVECVVRLKMGCLKQIRIIELETLNDETTGHFLECRLVD